MDALRRVLVALGGLVCVATAALLTACLVDHNLGSRMVDFVDRCFLYNLQLTFLDGQQLWWPIVIGVALLAIGLLLLIAALYRVKPPAAVEVKSSDGSMVLISLEAVDNVVKRAAGSVPQVSNLASRLRLVKGGLYISLRISIPASAAIPEVGAAVRQQVAEQLETMVGVAPREIRVEVANVVDQPKEGGLNGI